ncbi:hypothetical protein J4E08_23020 [Sagittula sp. NFXS13]|uniref:hypothetical protein n=1 Tax=Sagittula sp. NFXS13 TaxID=2819095 RepID=UPI0032DFAA95
MTQERVAATRDQAFQGSFVARRKSCRWTRHAWGLGGFFWTYVALAHDKTVRKGLEADVQQRSQLVTWLAAATVAPGPQPTSKTYLRCCGAARHCCHSCRAQHFDGFIVGVRTWRSRLQRSMSSAPSSCASFPTIFKVAFNMKTKQALVVVAELIVHLASFHQRHDVDCPFIDFDTLQRSRDGNPIQDRAVFLACGSLTITGQFDPIRIQSADRPSNGLATRDRQAVTTFLRALLVAIAIAIART